MDRQRLIVELRDIAYREREYLADVTGDEPRYIAELLYVAADLLEQDTKTAHWVRETYRQRHWHCSQCGHVIGAADLTDNYCPRCGAKMRQLTHSQLMAQLGETGYETD